MQRDAAHAQPFPCLARHRKNSGRQFLGIDYHVIEEMIDMIIEAGLHGPDYASHLSGVLPQRKNTAGGQVDAPLLSPRAE